MNNEDNSFNNQGIMNEEPEQMEEQNFPRANGNSISKFGKGLAQCVKNAASGNLMKGVPKPNKNDPSKGQKKPDDKKKKDGLDKKNKDGNKDKKKDNEHKNPLPGAGGKKSKDPRDANDKKPSVKKENGGLKDKLSPKKLLMNKLLGKKGGALGKKKDTDEGGESKTKSSLIQSILGAKLIKVKIAVMTIVPMIILLLFLFNVLFGSASGGVVPVLCSSSGSSTYNGEGYTGSADMLDFACSSQHPLANKGLITSWSGPRWGSQHEGIDIGVPTGTPVYAVQAGTVTLAGVEGGYGNSVVIAHTDAISTRYGHNSELLVKVGDKVAKGQMIAKSGNTGHSTGPHLHFEFVYNGQRQYDLQNQYFGVDEKNGAENVSSLVGENFKNQCGSKWKGELAGDSASQANDTSDSYVSTSSSSSSANCCVSSTGSSSSSEDYCPNGVTVVPGPEGDTSGYNKDPDKFPIGTFSLDDYIQMVVGAENPSVGAEAIKAQMVAAKTYTIKRTNNCSSSIRNSEYDQTAIKMELVSDEIKKAYSEGGNSVITLNGDTISSEYSSFLGTCSSGSCTGSSIKVPGSEKVTYTMPEKYLTTKQDAGHGRGMSQNYAAYLADQGKTYKEILEYFYADGIEINGGGNTCSIGGDGFNGNIRVYYQSDYPNVAYCSGKGEHNVAVSGCGPTAMAIVVSSLLGEEHNPEEMAKYSCKNDFYVPGTGTKHAFFASAGKKYGLSVKQLDVSEANNKEVLIALNSGKKLVIAATNKKPFTSGGHFIVLTSHKDGQVFVQDPNKSNDSKLFDFEEVVVPATTRYWIISKE